MSVDEHEEVISNAQTDVTVNFAMFLNVIFIPSDIVRSDSMRPH